MEPEWNWRVGRRPQSEWSRRCLAVSLRVQSPVPLGDVTMVPATLSGQPDTALARAMAAALADIEAPTAAEVYRQLRRAFPLAPLSARVAALGVLMERLRRAF
jgi:hypothetical protein